MGNLTNEFINQTYPSLVKFANSYNGVSSSLQNLQDGIGDNLPIQISTTQVNISGSLLVNGQPISGATGSSGTSGTSGQAGSSGTSGTSGVGGSSGTSGTSGASGANGSSGTSGTSGGTGSSGTSGTSGINGTSFTWKGTFSPLSGYSVNDVTNYNGSSYICIQAYPPQTFPYPIAPGSSPTYWSLVAQAGTNGTSGTSGVNGSSGTSGTSGTSGSNGSSGTSGTAGTSGTSGQNGISAGRTYYFNQSQTSDVAGYKVLSDEPTSGATQTVTTSITGSTNDVLISSYITPELGFPVIPSGVQRFYLHFKKPAENDNLQAYVTIQLANSTGGTIGSLLTASPEVIGWNGADAAEVIVEYVFPTTNIDPTYRMIVKIYANNLDSTTHSLNYLTENGDYSFVITSVGVVAGTSGTSGTSGINGTSGTSGTSGIDGSSGTSGASPFAQTGSFYNTTNNIGITGSLNVRGADLDVISNNTTVNNELYLTSSLAGQSNIILGWGENPAAAGPNALQSNYTGSLRITGSNNIVALPQPRATGFGGGVDQTGYISGSNNFINSNQAGIYLNTGSLLFPKTAGNILSFGSSISMNYTTSSIAGGHPVVQNNILNGGGLAVNSNSGSINLSNNILAGGQVTSTQNFVTNVRSTVLNNNVIGAVTLNHISSSILYNNNYNNSPITINNHLSSSAIANNSLTVANNIILGGSSNTPHNIYVSGSQSSNVTRQISDNLIGGRSNVVSSSFVSSSNAGLTSTIIYGRNLAVSASHSGNGGSAFFGRFNATGSLQESSENTLFVVGSGTADGARRNAFRIDNNSNSYFTGSLNIEGATYMSQSAGFPLTVDGTINSKRLHFTGNPFNTDPASNLAAIRFDSNNNIFYSTNYDLAQITTQSQVFQTVITGSGLVETGLQSNNYGSDYYLKLTNQSGVGLLSTNANTTITGSVNITGSLTLNGTPITGGGGSSFPYTGSAIITGSLTVTGSVNGNVNALSITSQTASLNLNDGNFFTLQLVSGSNTRIEPSNIKAGQTVNVLLSTTGSGTVSFPTSVKQISGSSYIPTTTTGTDIITLVSFDSSTLNLVSVKNLV